VDVDQQNHGEKSTVKYTMVRTKDEINKIKQLRRFEVKNPKWVYGYQKKKFLPLVYIGSCLSV